MLLILIPIVPPTIPLNANAPANHTVQAKSINNGVNFRIDHTSLHVYDHPLYFDLLRFINVFANGIASTHQNIADITAIHIPIINI